MSIHLRATGWPCTIVGLGDRKTGLCRVRLVGGPDDGREIDGVHYSELGGASVECAFYGRIRGTRTGRSEAAESDANAAGENGLYTGPRLR